MFSQRSRNEPLIKTSKWVPSLAGRPSSGMWYLDNGDGVWSGCGIDICSEIFGAPGDLPFIYPSIILVSTLLYDNFTGNIVSSTKWHIPTWVSPTDGTFVGRTHSLDVLKIHPYRRPKTAMQSLRLKPIIPPAFRSTARILSVISCST
jgi:hypothetical protein